MSCLWENLTFLYRYIQQYFTAPPIDNRPSLHSPLLPHDIESVTDYVRFEPTLLNNSLHSFPKSNFTLSYTPQIDQSRSEIYATYPSFPLSPPPLYNSPLSPYSQYNIELPHGSASGATLFDLNNLQFPKISPFRPFKSNTTK